MPSLAEQLKTAKSRSETPSKLPHLIIVARAGTGKTTTLVEGLHAVNGKKSKLIPSPQQAAVWDELKKSRGAKTICFAAFNSSIKKELESRVPEGCEAATMHSLGFRSLRKAFPKAAKKDWKCEDILAELSGKTSWNLKKERPELVSTISQLAGLCRSSLLSGTEEELLDLIEAHSIETNDSLREILHYTPQVVEMCKDIARWGFDFTDMIWAPLALKLSIYKYDLLLVDEAQDLNRCQQELAFHMGKRLIFCGDDRQAIYGFAGADCSSLSSLAKILGETANGVTVLPLTVTRRCGQAIVKEAKELVPDFEAHPDNTPGKISYMSYGSGDDDYRKFVGPGDMVLCRCNAPLVRECFRFLRDGIKANIQGRDVGVGLFNVLKKIYRPRGKGLMKREDWIALFEGISANDLLTQLSQWVESETLKEQAKSHPSERKIETLSDKYNCLVCFTEGAQTVGDVVRKMDEIFTDTETTGVLLSSCHKAKGLEADNVFLLRIKEAPVPHPMAKTQESYNQELNLLYIAITRAKHVFTYVTSPVDD